MIQLFGIAVAILICVVVICYKTGVLVVHSGEAIIIERMGRYSRVLEPGVHLLIPVLESVKTIRWTYNVEKRNNSSKWTETVKEVLYRIPLGERIFDLPVVEVLSSDQLPLFVNIVMFYKVEDCVKVAYNIEDMTQSLEQLVYTSLRDIASRTLLDEAIVGKDLFQREVKRALLELHTKWGVSVPRVDIQSIDVSPEIRQANTKLVKQRREAEAMDLMVKAERKAELSKIQTEQEIAEARATMKSKEQAMRLEQEKFLQTAELQRKKEAAEMEIIISKQQLEAKIALEKLKAESEIEMQLLKAEKDREMQRSEQELELELESKRKQIETDFYSKKLLTEVEARKQWVELHSKCGLKEEFFIQCEYTKNFAEMMKNSRENGGNLMIIPSDSAKFMGGLQLQRMVEAISNKN